MNDTLRWAEFALLAAPITMLVALVANIVVLAAKPRTSQAKAKAQAKAKVMAGGGEAQPIEAGRTTAAATKGSKRPSGLAAYATGFTWVSFLLVTVYLGVRMSVTGHGPFSNSHEFITSFVWGILLAYIISEWVVGLRILSVGVLPVAFCLALYALRLDSGVDPLVPALQNNLLLTLHVGFAILAYGAACVSFAAAVMLLLRNKAKFGRFIKVSEERLDDVGYKAAVITFPLLTLMIVLGAVWANIAWGRYWSWDPKETAALVTWLVYGAFLHARVVRGWRGRKAAWLLLLGFATIFVAYFGNYFFEGLHSYAT